jgi:hypothetical protein
MTDGRVNVAVLSVATPCGVERGIDLAWDQVKFRKLVLIIRLPLPQKWENCSLNRNLAEGSIFS